MTSGEPLVPARTTARSPGMSRSNRKMAMLERIRTGMACSTRLNAKTSIAAQRLLVADHIRWLRAPMPNKTFLTTHTGSLPRPADLTPLLQSREDGTPPPDLDQ